MQLVSSYIAESFLRLLGVPVYREGNIIDIGTTRLQVVAACSGLRYLIPMLLVGFLMGDIMHTRHTWRKFFLFCTSLPLAILMNGVRLSLTALLAREYGSWIVEGIYHEILGWCIFVASILFLFLLMRFLESKDSGNLQDGRDQSEKIRFSYRAGDTFAGSIQIKPLVAILLITVSAFFLRYTQKRHQYIPYARNMKYFPKKIGRWEGVRLHIHPKMLTALDVTDYVLMNYVDDSGKTINFYIAYYASQSKGESIHSPETCMRGAGWRFVESGVKEIFDGIKVNRSLLANQNRHILSYFWFPCRGRDLTNGIELKVYNFLDSLTRGRTDGALVRVITNASTGTIHAADKRILDFLKNVMPVVNNYLPNK